MITHQAQSLNEIVITAADIADDAMQARELVIHKALAAGDRCAGVTIHIHEPVPDLWRAGRIYDSLDAYAQFYDEQAQQLADALTAALPGGTLDRLLAKLLTAKAGHFRVPWPHTETKAGAATDDAKRLAEAKIRLERYLSIPYAAQEAGLGVDEIEHWSAAELRRLKELLGARDTCHVCGAKEDDPHDTNCAWLAMHNEPAT